MTTRALGANASFLIGVESGYGVAATGNVYEIPLATTDLGGEDTLEPDELLGRGREPDEPDRGPIDVKGSVEVPLCQRNTGIWLWGLFGPPVTTGTVASGQFTFSDQPGDGATVTLNGVVWTLVAADPADYETLIQPTLAQTLTQLAVDLGAADDAVLKGCRFAATATTLTVRTRSPASAGNVFTLAASADPVSNATPSGATLSGASGESTISHVYRSGAATLPSFTAETGMPDVGQYFRSLGVMVGSLALAWAPKGRTRATVTVIGQNEIKAATALSSAPIRHPLAKFRSRNGEIKRNGTALGQVTSAKLTIDNSFDPVSVIRSDGMIDGVDLGKLSVSGEVMVRYTGEELAVTEDEPIALTLGWKPSDTTSLTFDLPVVHLKRSKKPLRGPRGVEVSYSFVAARPETGSVHSVTATLKNDVESYS